MQLLKEENNVLFSQSCGSAGFTSGHLFSLWLSEPEAQGGHTDTSGSQCWVPPVGRSQGFQEATIKASKPLEVLTSELTPDCFHHIQSVKASHEASPDQKGQRNRTHLWAKGAQSDVRTGMGGMSS